MTYNLKIANRSFKKESTNIDPIRWRSDSLELLDQRFLPNKIKHMVCRNATDVRLAIKSMVVRGAPAIGIAGAYGLYLGMRDSRAQDFKSFRKGLVRTASYLEASRPTARNLSWALERLTAGIDARKARPISALKSFLLKEASDILKEDVRACREMGRIGATLIKKGSRVITHCNAGAFATGGFGTALGVIKSAGRNVKKVYVDETRPVLQGARLTVLELMKAGMPAMLICDNMSAALMEKKEVDAVIVGADRIAANGDVANKIGTYNLAVLADYHKVPFYVAAPSSTFDLSIATGDEITIEERSADEVRKIVGKLITVRNAPVWNPAFDMTPAKLVTAIITEKGIIKSPDKEKIAKLIGSRGMGRGETPRKCVI